MLAEIIPVSNTFDWNVFLNHLFTFLGTIAAGFFAWLNLKSGQKKLETKIDEAAVIQKDSTR